MHTTRLGAGARHRLLRPTLLLLLLLTLLLLGRHVRGAGLLVAHTLGVLEVPAAGSSRALIDKHPKTAGKKSLRAVESQKKREAHDWLLIYRR